MPRDSESLRLREVIRGAVLQAEESSGVAPDDPAMVELKHSVARAVGELEVAKARRQDEEEL